MYITDYFMTSEPKISIKREMLGVALHICVDWESIRVILDEIRLLAIFDYCLLFSCCVVRYAKFASLVYLN